MTQTTRYTAPADAFDKAAEIARLIQESGVDAAARAVADLQNAAYAWGHDRGVLHENERLTSALIAQAVAMPMQDRALTVARP